MLVYSFMRWSRRFLKQQVSDGSFMSSFGVFFSDTWQIMCKVYKILQVTATVWDANKNLWRPVFPSQKLAQPMAPLSVDVVLLSGQSARIFGDPDLTIQELRQNAQQQLGVKLLDLFLGHKRLEPWNTLKDLDQLENGQVVTWHFGRFVFFHRGFYRCFSGWSFGQASCGWRSSITESQFTFSILDFLATIQQLSV